MKYKNLYIAASSQHVGKTTTTLGLVSVFMKRGLKIGYCKPVGQKYLDIQNKKVDKDTLLFADLLNFELRPKLHSPIILGKGSTEMLLDNPGLINLDSLLLNAKNNLSKNNELVIYEGTGHPGVGSVANLSNARVAKMLDAAVIMVIEGGIGSTIDMLHMCTAIFREENVPIIGVIINKVWVEKIEKIRKYVSKWLAVQQIPLLGIIPYDKSLAFPLVESVVDSLKGIVTHNPHKLENKVENIIAGSLVDLKELKSFQDLLLVASARTIDRAIKKIISFSSLKSIQHSPLSGIVLTGEGDISEEILEYIDRFEIPMIRTNFDTYGATLKISRIEVKINRHTPWKVNRAIELIEENVDLNSLLIPR